MNQWNRANKIGFDFETSGTLPEYALQPWRMAQGHFWATSLVWMHHGERAARGGDNPTRDDMAAMLQNAVDNDLTLVGWTAPFDIQVLLAYGLRDLVMRCKFLDGMLFWKHATVTPEYDVSRSNKKHYGLKALVAELWPEHAGYDEDIDFHSTDPAIIEKRWRYNIRDVIFTLKGAEYWWNQLTREQQHCALIEARCLPLVAEANFNGMLVDTFYANDLACKLETSAQSAMAKLEPYGVTPAVLRSPTQLSRLLFAEWGLKPIKQNKTASGVPGSLSTDKETLHELSFLDERAKFIKTYRESVGNKSKFADAVLKSVTYNEDGCTHPQAFVYSTYTGRMTYASTQGRNKDARPVGFAIHQEKRGKEFRSILIPPPDHDLVEFDAAGQEFKWMAVASGDPTMLHLCLRGHDPHTYMGAQIAYMDYFELMILVAGEDDGGLMKRKLGKLGNLSLQYRTSAKRLCSVARVDYDMPMTIREAEHIWRTYSRTYTMVPVYWDNQIMKVKRAGYVETYAGRRVQMNGDWNDRKLRWSLESTAINFPIQGTGADQKYLALMCLRDYCREHAIRFLFDMHDGLYFLIPKAITEIAVPHMKHVLDTLPYKKAWGFEPPVQMTFDAKVGPSWGGLKKWAPK